MFKKITTLFALGIASACVLAQTTPPTNSTVRLRGVIEKIEVDSVTIKERRGETITLAMAENTPMNEVYPIKMEDIKAGSFIGTAAMPKADGTLEALEVLVFPEAMRGTGEGHNPWDLQKDSTMTNATVADLKVAPSGRQLRLTYKGGEKIVNVAEGAPIVTFRPGEKSLLVVGAKVLIQAQEKDGEPTALRMTIGRNGFAPPM
jgi:hypothetical protein